MKSLTLQEQLEEIGKKFYADSLIGRPNKKHFSENMSGFSNKKEECSGWYGIDYEPDLVDEIIQGDFC